MKGIDLTKLIEGLLIVILIAIFIGKYRALQDFARREAAASVRGWPTHAFFLAEYRKLLRAPHSNGNHLREAARTGATPHPDQFHSKH